MRNTTITSKLGILLITISLCFSPINTAPNNDPQHFLQNNYVKNSLIITGLFTALYVTAPEEIQEQLTEQLNLSNLAKNFLKEFSSQAFATFCHEQGHSLMAQYFTGRPTEIHLGAHCSPDSTPYYTIGNVHIDGCSPRTGATRDRKLQNKVEQSIILLAGGTSGLIGHHIFKFATTYFANFSENRELALVKGIKETQKLDHISFSQIFNALLPIAKNIDSMLIDIIIDLSPIITTVFCSWYYSRNAHESTQKIGYIPLHSEILQYALNFYLNGFLRFEIEPI